MIKVYFAWYDLWIGVYVDTKNKYVYICPLPMLVIRVSYRKRVWFSKPVCAHCGRKVGLTYMRDKGLDFCDWNHMVEYLYKVKAE